MKTLKQITFTLLIISSLLSFSYAQKFQSTDSEFTKLLKKFEKEQTSLTKSEAAKHFGIDTASQYFYSYNTGKIVFQSNQFIALEIVLPCQAGGTCESSKLAVFNKNGQKISEMDDFEYIYAEDTEIQSGTCTYSADNIYIKQVTEYQTEEGGEEFMKTTIHMKLITINDEGKIKELKILEIDNRRNYYHLSTDLLTNNELKKCTKDELAYMRNEIFAAHGYIFKTDKMKNYFKQFDWYKPQYDNVDDKLTLLEKKNIELIKKHEK